MVDLTTKERRAKYGQQKVFTICLTLFLCVLLWTCVNIYQIYVSDKQDKREVQYSQEQLATACKVAIKQLGVQ